MAKTVETIRGDGFTVRIVEREIRNPDFFAEAVLDDGTKIDVTLCSTSGEARSEILAAINSCKK